MSEGDERPEEGRRWAAGECFVVIRRYASFAAVGREREKIEMETVPCESKGWGVKVLLEVWGMRLYLLDRLTGAYYGLLRTHSLGRLILELV